MANSTKKQLTSADAVKVINNTTGMTSFMGIDDKRWSIRVPNGYKMIPLSIIEGLYNDHPSFITKGYIIFEDENVYKYLQIDEEIYKKLLPITKVEEFLQEKSAEELEKELAEMPSSIQENIAIVAKEKGLDSTKKRKAIKKVTGFDVEPDSEEEE